MVVCGLVILAGAITWLERGTPTHLKIADNLLGESWYGIRLGDDHVGFMHNHAHRDVHGQWHFRSLTHFRLEAGAPNTIDKHLVFASTPPHELKRAIYRNREGANDNARTFITAINRSYAGYTAELVREGRANETDLDWQFTLNDFVDFESWLHTDRPEAGASRIAKMPDFERLRIVQRTYSIVEHNAEGYLISTNAPWDATRTQLDGNYRPLRLSMAGIFDVTESTQAEAVALHRLPRKTTYLISLNERIHDREKIASLKLAVTNPPPSVPRRLTLKRNIVTTTRDASHYTGEELRYPINDTRIRSLVRTAEALTDGDAVEKLVSAVNATLDYAEDDPAGSVQQALTDRRGECTDFADLFTTAARAAGYPARTVYGLAYRDGNRPSFMFHAWNEIFSNDRWRAVDPTWNQPITDATHLPLSESQAAAMVMAASSSTIALEIVDIRYDDS